MIVLPMVGSALSEVHSGTVSEFDEVRGLGEIVDDRGHTIAFHCVSIADGSRQIDVTQRVAFVTAFKVARCEAIEILKTDG